MMKKTFIVALCILFTIPVWAQENCDKIPESDGNIIDKLQDYNSNNCWQKAVDDRLTKVRREPDKDKIDFLKAWESLSTDVENDSTQIPAQDPLHSNYQEVRDRCRQTWIDVVAEKKDETTNMARNNYWILDNSLYLTKVQNRDFEQIDLKVAFKSACEDEGQNCPKTYERSTKMIDYLASAQYFARAYSNASLKELQTQLKEEIGPKWDKFLYDSKPMYPWDIMFTDFIYDIFSKKNRFTYRDGFHEPPEWQFFIAHPSAAFEYVDDAEDGEQLKPAIIAELIGVNHWEKGLLGFTGLSLIVSYSDRKSISDVGWGGLITYDNVYSFGVTSHSSDIGVFVSLDLANFFREKVKPSWKKGRNFLDVVF